MKVTQQDKKLQILILPSCISVTLQSHTKDQDEEESNLFPKLYMHNTLSILS